MEIVKKQLEDFINKFDAMSDAHIRALHEYIDFVNEINGNKEMVIAAEEEYKRRAPVLLTWRDILKKKNENTESFKLAVKDFSDIAELREELKDLGQLDDHCLYEIQNFELMQIEGVAEMLFLHTKRTQHEKKQYILCALGFDRYDLVDYATTLLLMSLENEDNGKGVDTWEHEAYMIVDYVCEAFGRMKYINDSSYGHVFYSWEEQRDNLEAKYACIEKNVMSIVSKFPEKHAIPLIPKIMKYGDDREKQNHYLNMLREKIEKFWLFGHNCG